MSRKRVMEMGDFAPADDHFEELEPKIEEADMEDADWLEKWELEHGLTPNLPSRNEQFAVTVAMDAFRLCIGMEPRTHNAEVVFAWIGAMRSLPTPSPFPTYPRT